MVLLPRDIVEFILSFIGKRYYVNPYWNPHTRKLRSRCFDVQLSYLFTNIKNKEYPTDYVVQIRRRYTVLLACISREPHLINVHIQWVIYFNDYPVYYIQLYDDNSIIAQKVMTIKNPMWSD